MLIIPDAVQRRSGIGLLRGFGSGETD